MESTQESEHEEVYMTSNKMSSAKKSSAGSDQPRHFEYQSHQMPTPISPGDHLTP